LLNIGAITDKLTTIESDTEVILTYNYLSKQGMVIDNSKLGNA